MGRTLLRQDVQIRNSDIYADTVAVGITLETGAAHLEDDLNAVRSQMNRVLDATGTGKWYDDVATINAKKRGLKQLNTDLDGLEEKKLLCAAALLTDVVVQAAQNFAILGQAAGETPSQVIAILASTDGAVVAQTATSGAAFAVHELDAVVGADALHPKNLVSVVDATTGQKIQSSGRDVFGLLQVESSATDGQGFNDTSGGNRGKISFVRPNATFNGLEAVPTADIQGKTIRYKYAFRIKFDAVPEECFINLDAFVDQTASVDVNLTNAIANEIGNTPQNKNVTIDMGGGFAWVWRDAASANIMGVEEGSGSGSTLVHIYPDADQFLSEAVVNSFNNGLKASTSKTRPINVGVNDGVVESTVGDLEVRSASLLYLDDVNQPVSWAQTVGIALSDNSTEWSDFENAYGGEVSLLNALVQAKSASARKPKVYAVLTANVNANTDVGGVGGGANLDAQLPDMSAGNFVQDYDVFVNGALQRGGNTLADGHDYYKGTDLTIGQLKFTYKLKSTGVAPDVIAVVPYA